jgi:hypothetical protein
MNCKPRAYALEPRCPAPSRCLFVPVVSKNIAASLFHLEAAA